MKIDLPKSCSNCGSSLLSFEFSTKNNGKVQDGRLCMNEIGIVCFIGCDECSETLKVIDADNIADYLTEYFYDENPSL